MNNNPLLKYVEDNQVKDSKTVIDKEGLPQGGYYTTSKASEIASNLYNGMHSFTDTDGATELWTFGKLCVGFGIVTPSEDDEVEANVTERTERVRKNTIEKITIKSIK